MSKLYLWIGSIFIGVDDCHIDNHLQADLLVIKEIIKDESVVLLQS